MQRVLRAFEADALWLVTPVKFPWIMARLRTDELYERLHPRQFAGSGMGNEPKWQYRQFHWNRHADKMLRLAGDNACEHRYAQSVLRGEKTESQAIRRYRNAIAWHDFVEPGRWLESGEPARHADETMLQQIRFALRHAVASNVIMRCIKSESNVGDPDGIQRSGPWRPQS
ncbi:hypothetical protein P3T23_005516 [Paraburkholderia sp. GAS448]